MARQSKTSKTIVLPILEENYESFIKDASYAHEQIASFLCKHPELFPSQIQEQGYVLKGKERKSKKLDIRLRRIKIGADLYRIRPSFALPYMRGKTHEVANALLLIRFGVPFWVLAFIFGRNAMYWYRLFVSLSAFNLVGTTVYNKEQLPKDLLADEFHTRIKGVKAYVATIISKGCFLCTQVSAKADEASLRQAYGVFKQEVQAIVPDYQPTSFNTDGWVATQNALQFLFPLTCIVECFLHAFIKVRDRATKALQQDYKLAADKIWNIYSATTKREMSQRIRRLREWATNKLEPSAMKDNLLALCKKKYKWLAHFDCLSACRTSAHLDRIMKLMERHAINSGMFHSNINSTSNNFRALALIYNFSPSCPCVAKRYSSLVSPAARLNGFVYTEHWLENLFLAASLNGYKI